MRRVLPWLITLALTVALMAVTTRQALVRYREFRTGWSWDLAYYNQWLWAINFGDGRISVQPAAPYATEGPSVWKTNYLAPIRYALIPVYQRYPDPRTLLVVQNVVFWLVLPAAFTLVRSESRSDLLALSAVLLVPLTPLLWPLVWNDFRELQLALPFVLWGIQGYRGRKLGLLAVGIGGMLACRQEFALVVATMAILPPREPEEIGRTYRWARGVVALGLGWMLLAFFGYLHWVVASNAAELYVAQFEGPKATLAETLATAFDFLAVGLGSWAVLALFAPRAAALALPWVWSLSNGRWALRFLGTEEWHHVRYTAPMVALVLAAGCLGYARVGTWLMQRPRGRWGLAAVWLVAAAGLLAADREVMDRLGRWHPPIAAEEAVELWRWIDQVGPDDGVLAVYDVTAPLSSRRTLYSYILEQNKPKGYPKLDPAIRWAFIRKDDLAPSVLIDQGFSLVYRGPYIRVFRRDGRSGGGP
jgi:hypothetical protein